MGEAELLETFFEEAEEFLDSWEDNVMMLDEVSDASSQENLLAEIFRYAHNLKGSAGSVGLNKFYEIVHECEELIEGLQKGLVALNKESIRCMLMGEQALREILAKERGLSSDHVDTDTLQELLHKLLPNKENKSIKKNPGFAVFEDENLDEDSKQAQSDDSSVALEVAKSKRLNSGSESIRVDVRRVDAMLDLLGEFVVNQSYIQQITRDTVADIELERSLRKSMKITGELRDAAMSLRLVPIRGLFNKQKRVVKDASHNLHKNVRFETEGEWVEIDKIIADELANPLTHMLRNCVDHGMENNAQERVVAGKPEQGLIKLSAKHKDDHIIITIQDDGRGIDIEKVYQKAVQKGLTHQDRNTLSDAEILDFIFAAGFSTREQASQYSGRGVGMNVVRETISDLTGSIHVESELGLGTRFTMVLPLSLSVISGLVAEAAGEKFIVPISQLVSTVKICPDDIQGSVSNGRMVKIRDEFVGIVSIREVFNLGSERLQKGQCTYGVLIDDGSSPIVLEFDRILSQQSFIMKSLNPELLEIPGLKAGAVLGDGEPALVLNLFQMHSYWRSNIG